MSFGVFDDSLAEPASHEPATLERLRGVQQTQQSPAMFGVPPRPGDLPGQVILHPTPGPSAEEVLGAAVRRSSVVSLLTALRNRPQGGVFPPIDGYSAWDDLKDKPQYWEYAEQFAGFHNPAETRQLMERIDREKSDKQITAASGISGVVANVLADAPLMLLPGRVALPPFKIPGIYDAAWTSRITRAAESGLAWGGAGAAQEAALRASQITRDENPVVGIASSTILGAILGPAAHAMRPGLMEAAAKDLDRIRAELDAHVTGQPVPAEATAAAPAVEVPPGVEPEAAPERLEAKPAPMAAGWRPVGPDEVFQPGRQFRMNVDTGRSEVFEPGTPVAPAEEPTAIPTVGSAPIPTSAGAAAADTRQLKILTTIGAPGSLRDLTLGTALRGLVKLGFGDLSLRMMQRASVMAKRAYADVVELPFLTEETAAGKPASYGGSPLESRVKTQTRSSEAIFMDKLLDAWTAARFGADRPPKSLMLRSELEPVVRSALPTGTGPMAGITFEDFRKEVGKAAMYEQPHAVPQVNEAVQAYRAHRDPIVARAEKSVPGFKSLEPKEGEAHFDHDWNKPLIEQNRPEFVNHLVEKYRADELAKQQAQGRLQAYQNSLSGHEADIKRLTDRLERKEQALKEDEALREEVSRINKFAFERATAQREGQFKNVGGVAVPVPGKNIEKARGGAVFETKVRERGNTLADRASAHAAEVEEINERLQNAHANAAEMRGKIEEELGRWEGKSAAEAKSALKARAKYEAEREAKRAEGEPKGGRLISADEAVDRAVKRILGKERIPNDIEALRARAQQTTDRIIGSPDGRLPYEEASTEPRLPGGPPGEELRGSLSHRRLDVSNAFAEPWIHTDIMRVFKRFNRTFIPDVELAERFGDINMTNNFRQINEEYNRLIDATAQNAAERAKLTKEKAGAIEDLALVRDRLRGVNAIPQTASQRRMGKLSKAARNAVTITTMGLSGLNSITDAAGDVFMHGMASAFGDGWAPFMRSLMADRKYSREAMRQAKVAGIATETQTAARHHATSGIVDHDEPGSPAEKTLQWGADKMQLLNLLAPWTDFVKTISFTIGSTNLYRAAKAALKGTATGKQKMLLGSGNIEPALYEKIVADYEKHSNVVGGSRLPNTEDWRPETRAAFEGALHRSSNITVTTPGLDLPAHFDTEIGKILLQFKSFTAAATTRILIANLQRSDAQTLQGLVTSLALGMVGYKLNSIATGSPTSDRPQDWFKEATSRGNILGWLEEGNTLISKATAGKADIYRVIGADKPVSKTAAQSAVEHLLGPTVGKLKELTKVTGALSSGNITAGDIHSLRRVMFLQNLVWLNRAFTAVEEGADNAFGIKIHERKQ